MKFGGTSVESGVAIERAARIVGEQIARQPVVVVSAIGKTTSHLLAAGAEAAGGQKLQALARLRNIREMHGREAEKVIAPQVQKEAECVLDAHFQELAELLEALVLARELTPRSIDAIASYGERLSSQLIAFAFQSRGMEAIHVDARTVIVTDGRHTNAMPLLPESYDRLREVIGPLVRQNKIPVMGGFIGATEGGITTTLGRGGSDFSAAIIGAGLEAGEIQIWTDVDGVMTCDPKLIPNPHRVKVISFAEAAELAYFGAKVLHPATLLPAMDKNIPVLVLNSRRPDMPGTRIGAESVPCSNLIKAISCKRGIYVVNIRSTRMLMAHGFLNRIFEVFNRHETAVDMLASSEVSVSLTVDDAARLAAICDELRDFAEVTVEQDQAIICMVGDNIRHTPGVAARAFGALEAVNIRMISQGASRVNLGFVVAGDDLQKTVTLLHEEFFKHPDPAVFD